MPESNHERIRKLFDLVIEAQPSERRPLLERACPDDEGLRKRIEAMVAAAEEDRFLSEPTRGDANVALTGDLSSSESATGASPLREGPGTRIGPYRLLQLIGEGGFGSVFLAEQEKPVARKVALKIIKLGMDTRQVVARFEQERQALAMMDHPNIAKVLDAGATETGRPFFVMELVKGDPIVEYCDRNSLSIRDRLELLAQVCQAVQHAHTKGIIHRDIKPSNILVSTQDGRPNTKVIDFGIAKATASRLTEKTLFTEHRALIGTPEYMSPEQAEGSLDIDTRTDVYSLGVLLYELLTGTTPFSCRELRSAAYAEIQRIIREVEPPKPSTRLSENAETIASVAAKRHVEPKRLGTIVRGDLDWIVMKAMEKDRQRRYETANGLAADIRRHLSGEAVLAAPPSTAYRLRKFVHRNRAHVAAAGMVSFALLLGMATTAWQAAVASSRAEAARKAEAEALMARDAEKTRADELRRVCDFQATMLSQVDPTTAGAQLGRDVADRFASALERARVPEADRAALTDSFRRGWARVNATDAAAALIDRTILRPAVKAIEEQFKEQPLVDAQLRQALSERYRDLGLNDAAFPLQESALATRRRLLGEDHVDTLRSMDGSAVLLQLQGKYEQAEACVREVLERRRRVQGDDHAETLNSNDTLAQLLQARGKVDEAVEIFRTTLERSRRVLGDDHPDTIRSINNLASALQESGKLPGAEQFYREALDRSRRVRGVEHFGTLAIMNNVGSVLKAQGKIQDAERYFRESAETRRRVCGDDHPATIRSLSNLVSVLELPGRAAEAEPLAREAALASRRVLGEDNPDTLTTVARYAAVLVAQQRHADAEPYFFDTLARLRRVLGDDHPNTIGVLSGYGSSLLAQGKLAEAEQCAREALERSERVLGADHRNTIVYRLNLGMVLAARERFADAETCFRGVMEKARSTLGPEHRITTQAVTELGILAERSGRHPEAIALLAPIEAHVRNTAATRRARDTARYLSALGAATYHVGESPLRFQEAESRLLEAHASLAKALGERQRETLECVTRIVDLYVDWDKAEPGKGHDAKAAEWRAALDNDAALQKGT